MRLKGPSPLNVLTSKAQKRYASTSGRVAPAGFVKSFVTPHPYLSPFSDIQVSYVGSRGLAKSRGYLAGESVGSTWHSRATFACLPLPTPTHSTGSYHLPPAPPTWNLLDLRDYALALPSGGSIIRVCHKTSSRSLHPSSLFLSPQRT